MLCFQTRTRKWRTGGSFAGRMRAGAASQGHGPSRGGHGGLGTGGGALGAEGQTARAASTGAMKRAGRSGPAGRRREGGGLGKGGVAGGGRGRPTLGSAVRRAQPAQGATPERGGREGEGERRQSAALVTPPPLAAAQDVPGVGAAEQADVAIAVGDVAEGAPTPDRVGMAAGAVAGAAGEAVSAAETRGGAALGRLPSPVPGAASSLAPVLSAAARRAGRRRRQRPAQDERSPLYALKIEAAEALGLTEKVAAVGWGGLSAAEAGRVGAYMTRVLREGGDAQVALPGIPANGGTASAAPAGG